MKSELVLLIVFFSIINHAFAQKEQKSIDAVRVAVAPEIDGLLDDSQWSDVPVATNFTQYEPYMGDAASQNSKVKFVYTDKALFLGAMLYDSNPDSILTELGKRDDYDKNVDHFSFSVSPYRDGVASYTFMVLASGVQVDMKMINEIDDVYWNAVWKSEIAICDSGWIVEMEIPFSALRFPKEFVQEWDVNMQRGIRRYREKDYWNHVDKRIKDYQMGRLKGIENVKPPLRLSVTPYASTYIQKSDDDKSWGYSLNYGADIKYGINESFTLDATLIPDFGQVQSDDVVLNLTPFEVRYDEKRSFFMEGTDLFNRAGVFYSRRLGKTPIYYNSAQQIVDDSLNHYASIHSNPSETNIINATKFSGRTKKGLGVGVLNAMTSNTYSELKDSVGQISEHITQPFTNYSVIVIDQLLRSNSYISFINTNMSMNGYAANVSATEFKLTNKLYTYALNGNFKIDNKYGGETASPGCAYFINFAKVSGNFRFNFFRNIENDVFNPNDMGYLYNNNETTHKLGLEYNIYKPTWKILNWNNSFSVMHSRLYKPKEFSFLRFELLTHGFFKKRYLFTRFKFTSEPVEGQDFYSYSSFKMGDLLVTPSYWSAEGFVSTDYRNSFAIDLQAAYKKTGLYNMEPYSVFFRPRYRISDKLFVQYAIDYSACSRDFGYVKKDGDDNIYAKRKVNTCTNTIESDYIFNHCCPLKID